MFCCLLLVCHVFFPNLSGTCRNDAAPVFVHREGVFEGIRGVKGQSHPLVQLKGIEGTVSLCLLC